MLSRADGRAKAIAVFLLLGFGVLGACGAAPAKVPVEDFLDVELGGAAQKVLVQGDDAGSPVLLYLHGGPGDPAMLYSHAYSSLLRQKFLFVNWDQRGAGLSYRAGMDASKITEGQLCRDALELTDYLLERYKKEKIFILGHSFGSILGLKLARDAPGKFYAYVGLGQVLDWDRSVAYARRWLEAELRKAGDAAGLARLAAAGVPPMDLVIQYGGHAHRPLDYAAILRASPYYFEGYIERKDEARGFVQAAIERNGEYDPVPLMGIDELAIPAFFFEGRHDRVPACAPELVVEFCGKLKAPKKAVVWFEDSAHMVNLEEPRRFQEELVARLLPIVAAARPAR